MICPYCGEEINGAHQYDKDTGMCKDYYEEKDMDRFIPVDPDTRQEDQEDTESDFEAFDFELGKFVPLGHTRSSNPDLGPALRGEMGTLVKLMAQYRVARDRNKRELELLQSPPEADTEDK